MFYMYMYSGLCFSLDAMKIGLYIPSLFAVFMHICRENKTKSALLPFQNYILFFTQCLFLFQGSDLVSFYRTTLSDFNIVGMDLFALVLGFHFVALGR